MATVLIAEDQALQAGLLQSFICIEHTIVGVAATGDEAIELAEASDPDVVVMDIDMPNKSGIQATAEITAIKPDIPVIISTAVVSSDMTDAAFDAGADQLLTKPYNKEDLLTAIEDAL